MSTSILERVERSPGCPATKEITMNADDILRIVLGLIILAGVFTAAWGVATLLRLMVE